MKFRIALVSMALGVLSGCQTNQADVPLVGTWELVSATATEKDSTYSTFNPRQKMIKIINATHFAFLNHDQRAGKDSAALPFSGGGGTYTLVDSVYTEHLDYYVDPAWENNTFEFVVKINGDTLIQKGVEKLEKLGIDRVIVEKYRRVKKE
ncbi:lipocalin family protein [Larkinella sp. VNQ87]|uniref:lipocalin family protein n=1 Tax=Larkinella sp. VNQ87 TaxID=3400921 RepID=UPI003C128CFB